MIDEVVHLDEMLARLPAHLQDASNLASLLEVSAGQYQALESALQDMLVLRSIDTAMGTQLDGIGQIVDLARVLGETDEQYRTSLRTRVLSLSRSGEVETLIQAFLELTGSGNAQYVEIYPATFQISGVPTVDIGDPEVTDLIEERMRGVKAAGIQMILLYASGFTLAQESEVDGNGDGPVDSDEGFGSITAGETGGGGFAGLVGTVFNSDLPILEAEEPTWPGLLTDCVLDEGTGWLVAISDDDWDGAPATWADWAEWDSSPRSPIVYTRDVDLGTLKSTIPSVEATGDGSIAITEQHSSDGVTYSSAAALGARVVARYIRFIVSVSGGSPKLKTMQISFAP